ncbi:hypothetical protein C8R30_12041 [Nitrosomonas nitrosa]|uniref:Uncharacterized protein n=1 Tax=Nitrosomonas nitrosa TaxID=52442 RepID=A0A1I4SKC6_9PROT|nr:hypothetical protein C8R30_12041 [Nitrosomonas nitrosa]SFM64885.1 hypothetical protein SAMN05421880_1256 [Nitrosomonas nitrosa]
MKILQLTERAKERFFIKDEQTHSQILAMLGQSKIPNNINQLAKAAIIGLLVSCLGNS